MARSGSNHAEGKDAIAEFVALHDRVYASRAARWKSSPLHRPMLLGQTAATVDRELRPFVVLDRDKIVARTLAVIDARYLRHWNERPRPRRQVRGPPRRGDATRRCWTPPANGSPSAPGAVRAAGAARHALRGRRVRLAAAEDPAPESGLLSRPVEGRGLRDRARLGRLPVAGPTPSWWQMGGRPQTARRAGFRLVPLRDVGGRRTARPDWSILNGDLRPPLGHLARSRTKMEAKFLTLFEGNGIGTLSDRVPRRGTGRACGCRARRTRRQPGRSGRTLELARG